MSAKSIFITGAAAGIGRACAEYFHARGWCVGLYDVDSDGCEALARELGGERCLTGRLDVRAPEQWQSALEAFCATTGGLQVLLNNAGVIRYGAFEQIDPNDHKLQMDVNVLGVINGCHAAHAYLRATPGACVINMASASAIHGQPDIASYSASKFAVRGLTEGLNIEWAAQGIRVVDIWPLFVQTAMIQEQSASKTLENMGVHLQPEDIAARVYQAATYAGPMPRTHWPVGLMTSVSDLAARLLPRWLMRWQVQRLSGR